MISPSLNPCCRALRRAPWQERRSSQVFIRDEWLRAV
ncbi:hypothetical protein DTL21_14630 [Bremerella cremea]|nr:hypothetical protein DTL21_14630 [Bremerella cremea]